MVEIEKGNLQIKCPRSADQSSEECKLDCAQVDVRTIVGEHDFERWINMSLSRGVDSAEDLSWCPTASCGYAFVKDSSTHNCLKCGHSYCLDCRVEMHQGISCA